MSLREHFTHSPEQGWQVSAVSGLNRSDRNRFLPHFYQNIISAAIP